MIRKNSEAQRNVNQHPTTLKNTHQRPNRPRVVQNVLLVWLDVNITSSNEDSQNILQQLRSIVNDINLFTDPNDCVDFLSDVQMEKVFIIISDSLGQHLVPFIHPMTQIDAIYIFCGDKRRHEEWTKSWSKIKGVYTQIDSICEALQLAVKQCNQDSIGISFVRIDEGDASSINLDQLDPTFMYTQLFKNALLNMPHDKNAVQDLVRYCRDKYRGNANVLALIEEFDQEYGPGKAILWYTRAHFIFEMLNRALRLLETETIVEMGFFIHDLHRQIQQMHAEQVSRYAGKSFTVYRGQRLSTSDFEKLKRTQGALISFNSFLSTSTHKEVSLMFTKTTLTNEDIVGVLFVMTIDPKITSAPFANILKESYFEQEEEILFSMHAVFRIDTITHLDNMGCLFQVQLTLTADDDKQLRTLTKRIDEEVRKCTGWHRIGTLLIQVGNTEKAEELYVTLLSQSSNEAEEGLYNSQLGCIKDAQGEYQKALFFYEKALDIQQKTRPVNHLSLATSYNNIGAVYNEMREYSKTLSFYEKAQDILQKTLPANHPHVASSYNNLGLVYYNMGEYSKALSFYEKAQDILQKTLPANHPHVASSYNNLGLVYYNMGEYSKALSFYEKALDILQKTLPASHPSLATSYSSIAALYYKKGEYSKALSFYEKALDIYQRTLPANHPHVSRSYNNISLVYQNMGEYSKALSFYEKALDILRRILPANYPSLASSYSSIAALYYKKGEYSKALSFYGKALDIEQKILPANHSSLATSYNNIGAVYYEMGEYHKALSFYEKALDILQRIVPDNHLHVASSYNNIGLVYYNMGEYSKALSFLEIAVDIEQRTLSANHPLLASSYGSIGLVYYDMGEYSKALSFLEKALDILQRTLPANHPSLATSCTSIGAVYYNMGEYSKALFFLEKALDILQRSLPANHPHLQSVHKSIEDVKKQLLKK